jgi:hypothetical protein
MYVDIKYIYSVLLTIDSSKMIFFYKKVGFFQEYNINQEKCDFFRNP